MHGAIEEKREELAHLCRRFGVVRLEIFGSAARGIDFDPQSSDADFIVKFRSIGDLDPFEQFFDFADALRQMLGRPVDLVEAGTVRNRYLREAIDQSRELVYAA